MDGLRHQLTTALLVAAGALAACERAPARRADAAPVHVDSVVPRDVALARFREGLTAPSGLTSGAPTRDALVRAFVAALERGDTVALEGLTLSRAEFAHLYYPSSPQALPPYDLEPGLMWFLLNGEGRRGMHRALAERGGRPVGAVGHRCDTRPNRQGANTVWGPCVVRRVTAPGDTLEERLFGLILERDGRFKFVSLANTL